MVCLWQTIRIIVTLIPISLFLHPYYGIVKKSDINLLIPYSMI